MNFKSKYSTDAAFNMASMTDLVFLLLIFFMLVSTLVHTNAIKIVLPEAKGASKQNQVIALSITKKNQYFIGKEEYSKEMVFNQLEEHINNFVKEHRKQPEIVLRVEESVGIEKAVEVLDFANQKDYNIVLAVRKK